METKYCRKCSTHKPKIEFTKHSKSKDGLYYCCKYCKNSGRIYHPHEHNSQKAREYYLKTIAREPEYYRTRVKEYAKNNPDKIKEKRKRYALNGTHKMHTQRRRARQQELVNSLTKREWEQALFHFRDSCAYCGETGVLMQMEHFVPLSKGGSFSSYNIIPSCSKCNQSKHNKNPQIWYSSQPFYSESKWKYLLDWLETHALRNGVKLSDDYKITSDGSKTVEVTNEYRFINNA